MGHREQNSSCPVKWDDEPRSLLTEWEATPMKPTEDAKMQKEWPESVWLDAFEVAAIRSQGWDKPPTQHVAKQVANSKREYVSAARIAELETKLQAVLRREADANRAAFAHMRRITALEANGIAARKATAKNYARAEAAEKALAAAEARTAELVAGAYEAAAEVAAYEAEFVPVKPNDFRKAIRALIPEIATAALDQIKAAAEARGYARGLEDANRSHLKTGGECECGLSGPCMQENCRSPILRALAQKEAGE